VDTFAIPDVEPLTVLFNTSDADTFVEPLDVPDGLIIYLGEPDIFDVANIVAKTGCIVDEDGLSFSTNVSAVLLSNATISPPFFS
jgi:hypothetical protein